MERQGDSECGIMGRQKRENQEKSLLVREDLWVKGILPQTNFYRPNLIFWIEMGCGKAGFGRKGQKTPKIENLGPKVCPWDFEATCT